MKYCPPFRIHRWCYGSLQKSSISLKSFRFFFEFQENVLMDQKSSNLFVRMINKSSGRLTFTSAFVCMVLIRILFFSQKQMLTKTNPSRSVEIPFRSMTTRRKKRPTVSFSDINQILAGVCNEVLLTFEGDDPYESIFIGTSIEREEKAWQTFRDSDRCHGRRKIMFVSTSMRETERFEIEQRGRSCLIQ